MTFKDEGRGTNRFVFSQVCVEIELGVENGKKPAMIQLLRVTEENGCGNGVERGKLVEWKLVQHQGVHLVRLGMMMHERVHLLPFLRLLGSATMVSSPPEPPFAGENRSTNNSHRLSRERCKFGGSRVFPITAMVDSYLLDGSISIHVLNNPATSFRYKYTSAQRIIRRYRTN